MHSSSSTAAAVSLALVLAAVASAARVPSATAARRSSAAAAAAGGSRQPARAAGAAARAISGIVGGAQDGSDTSNGSTWTDMAEDVADKIGNAGDQHENRLNSRLNQAQAQPNSPMSKEDLKEAEKNLLPSGGRTRTPGSREQQQDEQRQPQRWLAAPTAAAAAPEPQDSQQQQPVLSYPSGLGPALMNGCTNRRYDIRSPCARSRQLLHAASCKRLLPAAAHVGVGFDARGFYSTRSRRPSLIQRGCSLGASFGDRQVPDLMRVFGIHETDAETKSFQSASEYLRYIRNKAGLSDQRGLFTGEASKVSNAVAFDGSFGATGTIAGAALGAYFGGPAGAQAGASLGGAVGSSTKGGVSNGKGQENSKKRSSSSSSSERSDTSSSNQASAHSFFATMNVNVMLYEVMLDQVRPTDISLDALRDFLSLPPSYYSVGADVKYQNFLLRWGTHYVRSAKFGGQLKVTKTCKTRKSITAEQFARVAETEFQSMFSTLESRYKQTSGGFSILGFGLKASSSNQHMKTSISKNRNTSYEEEMRNSRQLRQSEFTQTSVEALGGSPDVAKSLVEFYTPAFATRFGKWLGSIENHPKPFDFQLRPIQDLFNINMDDLFPQGNVDFGCSRGRSGRKVQLLEDPGPPQRWYYIDNRTSAVGNETVTESVRVYCRYTSVAKFKKDMQRRRMSLEKAVGVYMADGPFPTSSLELAPGETGCEQDTLSELRASEKSDNETLTFSEVRSAPFLLVFDLPRPIEGIASTESKFKVILRHSRWFAVHPKATEMHLFEGCEVAGAKQKQKQQQICFRNIALTYSEASGLFHVTAADFGAAKLRIPSLPNWLSGSTVAFARRLPAPVRSRSSASDNFQAIPCNVRWTNSHRLDPSRNQSCVHFTAASEGDIFVVFASIPRNTRTWYYLQINQRGVAIYKGLKLSESFPEVGIGSLGDANLYQSYFVCVTQAARSLVLQYGKADPDSEVGKVFASKNFSDHTSSSRLSFYSFGSGEKPVSLMDIRLTTQLPKKLECPRQDHVKVNGHCVPECHEQCNGCNRARDSTACHACRNLALVREGVVECVAECPAGAAPRNSSEKVCDFCPAGQFGGGNGSCSVCPAGTFSSRGSANCTLCPPGTFSSSRGSTNCTLCPPGTFSSSQGSTNCTLCPAGTHSSSQGFTSNISCTQCFPGTFSNSRGSTSCVKCAEGTFSSSRGSTSCKQCAAGTFSSSQGSVSCAYCAAGTFSSSGSINCTECAIGHFAPAAGQGSCSRCGEDWFANETGSELCTLCPSNQVSDASAAACKRCGSSVRCRWDNDDMWQGFRAHRKQITCTRKSASGNEVPICNGSQICRPNFSSDAAWQVHCTNESPLRRSFGGYIEDYLDYFIGVKPNGRFRLAVDGNLCGIISGNAGNFIHHRYRLSNFSLTGEAGTGVREILLAADSGSEYAAGWGRS